MVLHPDPKIRLKQNQLLKSLPKDKQENMSLFLSFGNAACMYYQLAEQISVQAQDYDDFAKSSSVNLKISGATHPLNSLPFLRYIIETKLDIGFDKFVSDLMGEKAFKAFIMENPQGF